MKGNKEKVAAVVVTYNRLELLQTCVLSLKKQTFPLAGIIVVNNSSTDGTDEWLLHQSDVQTITQPNLGGAAGFHAGIKSAFEKGYDWIWCMDDDGKPAESALEKLMIYSKLAPCVMNALVIDKDNNNNIVFKINGYAKRSDIKDEKINNTAAFFNGTLIHRDVVRAAGLPLKDLTIWGDETEYYNRIRFKYGYPVFTVSDSYHYHPAQYSLFYKREWDVIKDWKVYFYIRNKSFVCGSRYKSSIRSVTAYMTFLVGFAGTIFIFQKQNRWKKIKLLVTAAKHGLTQKTDFTIADCRKLINGL